MPPIVDYREMLEAAAAVGPVSAVIVAAQEHEALAAVCTAQQRGMIDPVLIGDRMTGVEDMPLVRKLTNRYMSWLLSRRMKQVVPDTQNGYRLYRCDVLSKTNVASGGFAAAGSGRVSARFVRLRAGASNGSPQRIWGSPSARD